MLRGHIEPIPEHIDEDRYLMRLGQALGVPAHQVQDLPVHWIGAARVQLEVEAIEARQRAEKIRKARTKRA